MRVGKGINCLSEGADFMKVSLSLFVPPIKIVIVHRVALSECWVILFGLRYGSFLVAFYWNCSGFVRDHLASLGLAAFDVFRLCLIL